MPFASAISDVAGIPEGVVRVVFKEVSEIYWFVGKTGVRELRAQS